MISSYKQFSLVKSRTREHGRMSSWNVFVEYAYLYVHTSHCVPTPLYLISYSMHMLTHAQELTHMLVAVHRTVACFIHKYLCWVLLSLSLGLIVVIKHVLNCMPKLQPHSLLSACRDHEVGCLATWSFHSLEVPGKYLKVVLPLSFAGLSGWIPGSWEVIRYTSEDGQLWAPLSIWSVNSS